MFYMESSFSSVFTCLQVDMAALSQMKDSDLKDMGVPMGPRKKILLAAAPYGKQRQR
uniref:SAM domain-containing protein n=1 Tax=Aegilops tauschii subsp. strangulata TaxID=200361 RepID=A0A453C5V3_AEGTS